jgi:hypothetical protein
MLQRHVLPRFQYLLRHLLCEPLRRSGQLRHLWSPVQLLRDLLQRGLLRHRPVLQRGLLPE